MGEWECRKAVLLFLQAAEEAAVPAIAAEAYSADFVVVVGIVIVVVLDLVV